MKSKIVAAPLAAAALLFTLKGAWAVWPPEEEEKGKNAPVPAAGPAESLDARIARDEKCLDEALRDLREIKDQLNRGPGRPKEK